MDKFEFGICLKELRKNRKLTIHQVETYCGVSNSYISLLERGKRGIPSPNILSKLAQMYHIEYEEIMIKAGYVHNHKNKIEKISKQIEYQKSIEELQVKVPKIQELDN